MMNAAMKHLAEQFTTMVTSPSPMDVFCYSPGIVKLDDGRIIGTMDFGGPGVLKMDGCVQNGSFGFLGRFYYSDDGGESWAFTAKRSMYHMRPFVAGNRVYAMGHHGDLSIVVSEDRGETWSEIHDLSKGQSWHQAPSNVWYKGEHVYLVMERVTRHDGWSVCAIAPVLMRANIHDDLTKRESWTFASELVFEKEVNEDCLKEFGIPFYPRTKGGYGTEHMGWLETNVVQLMKANDWFYDKTGKTFHLFMRAWTGLDWTGAILKVTENEDGSMITCFEYAPSGKRLIYTYIPGGGQSKFHILYDEKTKTYWLLSNQFIDGMVNFNKMTYHEQRGYDRSRLVLHYSYNCFDWLFAGVVSAGKTLKESRSYASMCFDNDDLLILSRTGDENALSGHDTNIISFHRVRNFRGLID
jgi:hypothetical protein